MPSTLQSNINERGVYGIKVFRCGVAYWRHTNIQQTERHALLLGYRFTSFRLMTGLCGTVLMDFRLFIFPEERNGGGCRYVAQVCPSGYETDTRPKQVLQATEWDVGFCTTKSSPATRHGGAWGERRYSPYSFLTSALDGVSGQRHAPAALLPPVPIVQEAGWDSEPVWTQRLEEKILCICRESNPDRPVVQPVVRHCTAWATLAAYCTSLCNSLSRSLFCLSSTLLTGEMKPVHILISDTRSILIISSQLITGLFPSGLHSSSLYEFMVFRILHEIPILSYILTYYVNTQQSNVVRL
jgi:hypothetical protein